MLIELPHRRDHQRNLGLLVTVNHPQIGRAGQILPALTHTLGEPVELIVGGLGQRQMRSPRPGLLALRPARPRRSAGFGPVLPTSSSFDGGLEEFLLLRESRCSTRASLAARSSFAAANASFAATNSAIRPACTPTSTISSSRDNPSRSGTPRSNRTSPHPPPPTRRPTTTSSRQANSQASHSPLPAAPRNHHDPCAS